MFAIRSMPLIPLLLLHLSFASQAFAASAGDIVEQARRAYRVENAVQTVRMVLVSKDGKERSRELDIRVRRDGEVLSSYTRFLSPSDVAGTQLVLVDHPDQEDEQLLFLPTLERVTRVSGSARSGAFLGSDFRYSDFEMDTGTGSVHAIVEEDSASWTIDTTPGSGSGWGRIRTRIRKSDYLPERTEYFGRSGDLARVLTVEDVQLHNGVAVAMRSVMKDLKRGSSTRMEVQTIRVKVSSQELPSEMFTSAYLERNG